MRFQGPPGDTGPAGIQGPRGPRGLMVKWRLIAVWQLSKLLQPTLRHWTLPNCTLGVKNKCGLIRCFITCVLSHQHVSASQGVKGALGPVGIIGPSGHPVCTSYLIPSAKLYVTSLGFLAETEWWSVFFLSIRDPRATKEVGGRRCVELFWWIPVCLYCEHRIGYLVWRWRATQALSCLQRLSFPIVLRCLLLHSQWHLAAVEIMSVW